MNEPTEKTGTPAEAAMQSDQPLDTSIVEFVTGDGIGERLRAAGVPLTLQRLVVAQVMLAAPIHLAADQVLSRARGIMPEISSIDLAWNPVGCTTATCESVTVTITSLNYHWISPVAGIASLPVISMPTFSTTLPRETMKQDAVAAPFACA